MKVMLSEQPNLKDKIWHPKQVIPKVKFYFSKFDISDLEQSYPKGTIWLLK